MKLPVFLLLLLSTACGSPAPTTSGLADAATDRLSFSSSLELADFRGQTYLGFMRETVKPAMDALATDGYEVRGADAVQIAYDASDTKVRRKVDRNFGGLANVKRIADALAGETVTLATLPARIGAVAPGTDRYNLATFLGLASGGGVAIAYADDNVALNVHYDVTEERSGRSFGIGPTRRANDASDKDYLDDLQAYSHAEADDLRDFYATLFAALLDSDTSGYARIQPEGQTLLTDFLAVFTAEQARNLMDGEVRPHWDAALLEVTLLASFHAGQDTFKLFYKDPATQQTSFTAQTRRQTPCEVPSQLQAASMRDYWQFSRNVTDPANCKRSGINVTKSEFRKLGEAITAHVKATEPALYQRLKTSLGRSGNPTNLFYELSKVLIDDEAPARMSAAQVREITAAWVAFLELAREQANDISVTLEAR